VLQPAARRDLERAGWRTTLEYRENHVRALDGRLLRVEPVWIAEAERWDGQVAVASAEAGTPDEAWDRLADDVAAANVRRLDRVRIAAAR
jgi:PPE-repeat protein